MRLRNVPGAREAMVESEYVVNEPKEYKGRWNELFGNSNPIRIEVGTGKGRFIMQLAAENPDVNYVGIEKYSSVLIRALEKQEEAQLPNIIFIRMDAEEITDVFGEGEVDRIYLNFSDPCKTAVGFAVVIRNGNSFLILVHQGRVGFFALFKGRRCHFLRMVLVRTISVKNRPVVIVHCLNRFVPHASILILLTGHSPLAIKILLFQTVVKAHVKPPNFR